MAQLKSYDMITIVLWALLRRLAEDTRTLNCIIVGKIGRTKFWRMNKKVDYNFGASALAAHLHTIATDVSSWHCHGNNLI